MGKINTVYRNTWVIPRRAKARIYVKQMLETDELVFIRKGAEIVILCQKDNDKAAMFALLNGMCELKRSTDIEIFSNNQHLINMFSYAGFRWILGREYHVNPKRTESPESARNRYPELWDAFQILIKKHKHTYTFASQYEPSYRMYAINEAYIMRYGQLEYNNDCDSCFSEDSMRETTRKEPSRREFAKAFLL